MIIRPIAYKKRFRGGGIGDSILVFPTRRPRHLVWRGFSFDVRSGEAEGGLGRFFYAVRKCSQSGHYFRV
jgi:hypothetical protein